eukprot:7396083-Alexandrium_andersonii.AAC.1
MSASLVGSEMCIRDRNISLPLKACSSKALQAALSSSCQPLEAARKRRPTVSYTHLTLPTICSV